VLNLIYWEKETRGYIISNVLMRARGLPAKREPLLQEVIAAE